MLNWHIHQQVLVQNYGAMMSQKGEGRKWDLVSPVEALWQIPEDKFAFGQSQQSLALRQALVSLICG